MGSLFQQGRVRLTLGGPKYHRLENTDPWIGLDDDEDDELINADSTGDYEVSNGRTSSRNGQFEELTIDVGNEDDRFLYDRRMLERQGSPLYKTFAAKKDAHRRRRRIYCALIIGLLCVLLLCLVYALLPCAESSESKSSSPIVNGSSVDFTVNFTGASESSIRLTDVNNDGIQDIIFGYARVLHFLTDEDMDDFCAFINMSRPCAGAVRALDGRDGSLLWELNVECEVFAILCDTLDANGDGQKDCLIAGRLGVLHAVDSTNGLSIWSVDPKVTNSSWNFYQPQVVPDLDGDGVSDVVVSHGGNGKYNPSETDRAANRLLLLSGNTGKSLGKFLETPDGKETYSAVTLYEKQDGAIYVLFGTGGETVPGSFWMISLWNLYCHVKGYGALCSQGSQVPALQNGDYTKKWGKSTTSTAAGVVEILRGDKNKGVMVPTVLADMNQDGVLDLIVSVFNGTTAVLDGVDLSIIWTTAEQFEGYETYSTPAPGYFNSDNIPDVMVRQSHGNWSAHYNSTKVSILDGRDGRILWSTESQSPEAVMTSPLSIKGPNNRDSFIFIVQGRHMDNQQEMVQTKPSDVKKDQRDPRHSDEEIASDCGMPSAMFECELFLLDRNVAMNPLRILTAEPYEYHYNASDEKARTFVPKSEQEDNQRHKRNHDLPSSHDPITQESQLNPLPQQQTTQSLPQESTASINTQSTETKTLLVTSEAFSHDSLISSVPFGEENQPYISQQKRTTQSLPLQSTASPNIQTSKFETLLTTNVASSTVPIIIGSKTDLYQEQQATQSLPTASPNTQSSKTKTLLATNVASSSLLINQGSQSDLLQQQTTQLLPQQSTAVPNMQTSKPKTLLATNVVVSKTEPQKTLHVDNRYMANSVTNALFTTKQNIASTSKTNTNVIPSTTVGVNARTTSGFKQQTSLHGDQYDPDNLFVDDPDQMADYFGHERGHQEDNTMEGTDDIDEDGDLCAVVYSMARSTGIVGDIDNDGVLDVVYIINYIAKIKDAMGGYITEHSNLKLIKTSLRDAQDYVSLEQERTFCDQSIRSEIEEGRKGFDLMLHESTWMGYMGNEGNSSYS